MVRGKFVVKSIEVFSTDPHAGRIVRFMAVYDDGTEENRRYSKATPSGSIEMYVSNPPAAAVFEPGAVFYVDFTKAEN